MEGNENKSGGFKEFLLILLFLWILYMLMVLKDDVQKMPQEIRYEKGSVSISVNSSIG